MEIILPDSARVERYAGAGGYKAEQMKIEIGKQVDVFGFNKITIPKGSVADEHYHEHFVELFYLLTPLRLRTNGEEHKLPAGAMVVLHPGDRHEEYADEENVSYLVLKLPYVEGDKVLTSRA